MINTVYLVEKLKVSPMENRNADWYEPYTFFIDEEELNTWLTDHQEYRVQEKHWSLFTPTPLYRVQKLTKS